LTLSRVQGDESCGGTELSAPTSTGGGTSPSSQAQLIEWAKIALIPIVIALIGYYFTTWQKDRDDTENNIRLYTQLVSQREQSDSQLRTEMFKAVIEKFLSGGKSGDVHDMVLKLELLAYNFHESLDLGPLFKEVLRNLDLPSRASADEQKKLRKRLDTAANTIVFQQVAVLSVNGQRWSASISPEEARESSTNNSYLIDQEIMEPGARRNEPVGITGSTKEATPPGRTGRQLRLQVLAMDLRHREVEVRLLVQSQSDGTTVVDRHFIVSLYDFPMLDNTRLPNGERCSVVLTDFFVDERASDKDQQRNSFANLDVVVFPATSASLKERIEYDELLRNMLRNKNRYGGKRAP
jgi:hypothetical protein